MVTSKPPTQKDDPDYWDSIKDIQTSLNQYQTLTIIYR